MTEIPYIADVADRPDAVLRHIVLDLHACDVAVMLWRQHG